MNEEIQRRYVEELIDQFCGRLNNVLKTSKTEYSRNQIIKKIFRFNEDLDNAEGLSAWDKVASEDEDNYL